MLKKTQENKQVFLYMGCQIERPYDMKTRYFANIHTS